MEPKAQCPFQQPFCMLAQKWACHNHAADSVHISIQCAHSCLAEPRAGLCWYCVEALWPIHTEAAPTFINTGAGSAALLHQQIPMPLFCFPGHFTVVPARLRGCWCGAVCRSFGCQSSSLGHLCSLSSNERVLIKTIPSCLSSWNASDIIVVGSADFHTVHLYTCTRAHTHAHMHVTHTHT